MKFSIITPTMNAEDHVLDSVRSMAAQTLPRDNIEWILIDGGSTDQTLERIEQQDFHPDLWRSEPNGGIYDALNRGVAMATGDFVSVLLPGDAFASNGVLYRVAGALRDTGADSAYGDAVFAPSGRPRHWAAGVYFKRNLSRGWMAPLSSFFLKREIFERARLPSGEYFDENYAFAADYEFLSRVLNEHDVEPAYLMMPLLNFRGNALVKDGPERAADIARAAKARGFAPGRVALGMRLAAARRAFAPPPRED